MKLLEKLLLPLDVNRDNEEQINAAIKISKEFNSCITVMYVLPESELHPEVEELLKKFVDDTLRKVTETLENNKVPCTKPLFEKGNPVNKILEVSTALNVNLILVDSGTRKEEDKFRLGTTAEKLIQLSDIPVWVTKSGEKMQIRRVLCPVDFSDPSKRAMKNAILLSRNFESTLHILGVVEPFISSSPRLKIDQQAENEKLQKQFEEKMNEFLSEFSLKRINHLIDVSIGIPHDKILKSIQKNKIDLLIMGTNGRSGFSRMFMGSVTEKVIREMPCSFVTTKTQNIFELRLDDEVKSIETHFNNAAKLQKNGFYNEAIEQYLICLQINDMHVPSMYKLVKLYKITGNEEKMNYYEKMASEILRRLWDKKIEFEIRRHYKQDG